MSCAKRPACEKYIKREVHDVCDEKKGICTLFGVEEMSSRLEEKGRGKKEKKPHQCERGYSRERRFVCSQKQERKNGNKGKRYNTARRRPRPDSDVKGKKGRERSGEWKRYRRGDHDQTMVRQESLVEDVRRRRRLSTARSYLHSHGWSQKSSSSSNQIRNELHAIDVAYDKAASLCSAMSTPEEKQSH